RRITRRATAREPARRGTGVPEAGRAPPARPPLPEPLADLRPVPTNELASTHPPAALRLHLFEDHHAVPRQHRQALAVGCHRARIARGWLPVRDRSGPTPQNLQPFPPERGDRTRVRGERPNSPDDRLGRPRPV